MSIKQADAWDQVFTELVYNEVFPNVLNRALIWGISQTGKSTLVHRLLNSERITFHQGMPIDDLVGGWTLRDGKTVWADGPAVRALRNGSCLQIDEADQIPLECKTVLYALMDNPAGITLPTGERVEASPGYCVVGTMNPNPTVLPEPIFNRFDIILRADKLSDGVEKALGPFVEHAKRCVAHNSTLEWSRPMSPSLLMAAARLRRVIHEDEVIAKALGLTDLAATDFVAAITE